MVQAALRPTSVPSGILIHPAVWPQQTWVENCGGGCALFFGGGTGSPSDTMWPGPRPTSVPSEGHLDPSSRLATIHRPKLPKKWGLLYPFFGGAGSPSNTMWPGPRPRSTSMPSFTLIHIQPFGHSTPTLQTDRQIGQTDRTTVR